MITLRTEPVYRALLTVYPPAFRREHGAAMMQLFRDMQRHRRETSVLFWMRIMRDLVSSAPAEWLDVVRAKAQLNSTSGGVMKPMAVIASLVGLLQVGNAVSEARGVPSGAASAAWMVSVALGVVAGLCLLYAGVALTKRTPSAATLAKMSGLACLALFIVIRLVFPWPSIIATALGIGFPVILLVYLQRMQPPRPVSA